ncbi:MAG: cellulase family glycosylhydrolase [Polyangiaceae bacterium]
MTRQRHLAPQTRFLGRSWIAMLAIGALLGGCNDETSSESSSVGGSTSISTGVGGAGGTSQNATFGGQTAALGGGTGNPACSGKTGFWVDGRFLRDRCCEKVVLRGVSEMVVWSGQKNGSPYFAEIAKTGANVVRIVWTAKDGTAAQLDAAIANALANKLIPMPELHDATGDMTLLSTCVDWWVRSDVVEVIKKYEDRLLINIANEVGNDKVTAATYTTEYTNAVTKMRAAGIHVPLIIDGSSWGQGIDMLQSQGPGLIEADPDHNLMFSVHMWWNDPKGARVIRELDESAAMDLPLIVGEFAQHAVYQCAAAPFDYKTLLAKAKELEIGYLAWSWGGVKNGDCKTDGPFDMTSNGTYDGLTDWGLEVAKTDPNSIQNTSVRPASIETGACR